MGDGTETRVVAADLDLAYRDSRLKRAPRAGLAAEIVLAATFRLVPASADAIRERRDDIRRWRQAHQPVGQPAAVSFFRYPGGVSADRLIDETGPKGVHLGCGVVSE